ncbi:MAG TPA: Xaa-Pro peptidase family protein [Planctomycetaceae bacterium]|nr:Xaa-Pro peptidase family protein [Planctomycetaceae bacterium]
MSRHDFTADEFSSRRSRAREAIAAAGLDWLIVIHPVSIRWLTGSDAKSYQEFQCLLIGSQPGPICVLTRDGETNEFLADALVDEVHSWGGGEPDDPIAALERVARPLGMMGARVGVEVPAFYLHPHHCARIKQLFAAPPVVEATNLIPDLTLVKSATELQYIREAARIADIGMARFAASLTEGRSELDIAGEVYHALLTSGSGLAASPINLVSGERSCFSHGAPTERRLRRGDFGNVEYGATYKRYTSTIGRQFCLGPPTGRMQELYNLVRRASDVCIAEIRAGVPAVVPHEAAKRVIADAGLNHGRVHTTGYGLAPGFPPTWGEPIHMFGGSRYTLEAGMVVTVEPPVFLGEERLGARIIDNVVVTETGCELLSQFSRDLIVAG